MPFEQISRRRFLKQSFAFSALAASGLPLHAAPTPDPKARHILMIGDWGWGADQQGQSAVADGMQKYAKKYALKTDCLFLLGDSFYDALPGGENDPRWKTQYEDMYPASVFPGPTYSIMGNHDYQVMPVSKVEAELAYAKRKNTRWTQPGLQYEFQFPSAPQLAGQTPLLRVIALDSNVPHTANSKSGFYTLTPDAYASHLEWMKAQLSKPTSAPFTIVMGHHPIFSNGKHGDHATLIRDWEPLLRQANVHVYLAGHDHDLQHIEFEGHPTSFVCSGAGGADLYDIRVPADKRGPFAQKVYGFTHMEVTPEKLTFRHVDAHGQVLHAFEKHADHSVKMLA